MDGEKHWNWKGNKIGYISIHSWNNKHHLKSGRCSQCKKEGKTVWALIKGRKHKRGIRNYKELCQKCHLIYDKTEEWVRKNKEALNKTYSHQNLIKPKNCEWCQKEFLPRRKTSRFCSNSCSARGCKKWLAINKK